VRRVGRFAGVRDGQAQFSGSLPNVCALADLKLGRLLDSLDAWADRAGVDAEPPHRFAPTTLPAPALSAHALSAPFGRDGIGSIVWATGRTCPSSTSTCRDDRVVRTRRDPKPRWCLGAAWCGGAGKFG
jgi:hypothetical protein